MDEVELLSQDEERTLREAVFKLASEYGWTYFDEQTRKGEHTEELWKALGEVGYLGVNLPEEYGGSGGGMLSAAAVIEEITRAGIVLEMMVTGIIVGGILARHGSEELKQRWLPGLASGEKQVSFALTEPDAGSNSHNLSTRARRDGDEYVIRGSKTFISGVDVADGVMVVARTGDDPETGRAKLSLIFVDPDAEGLERSYVPVQIHTPDRQFLLHFDDVRTPVENLVGVEGEGIKALFDGLNPERIANASQALGIGNRALDLACEYARQRVVWDVPIGAHQAVAHPLAKAKVDMELAALMLRKACVAYDSFKPAGEPANMAKYASVEAATYALDRAIQTHGGNGITMEYGLAPMWGYLRMLGVAPVSQEMALNNIAQKTLGLPRSY